MQEILLDENFRKEKIKKFQNCVFESNSDYYRNENEENIFRTLAYDLEFCYDNEGYLDQDKAIKEIKEILTQLENN